MNPKREGKMVNGKFPVATVRPNVTRNIRINWHDVPTDTLCDLVRIATDAGCAIMFGVTSDGGALSLLILDGGSKIKEYPHSAEEVGDILVWLRDEYLGTGGKPAS